MSALNGDKARYQRLRQAGLLRRERSRATLAALRTQAVRQEAGTDGTVAALPAPGLTLVKKAVI